MTARILGPALTLAKPNAAKVSREPIRCADCGGRFVRKSSRQRRCPVCGRRQFRQMQARWVAAKRASA